jgi:negative regulator of sigma E activity
MRGEMIDFNRLTNVESNTPALGNAKMNARGDILGQRGEVLKTQSQIEMEYRQRLQQQANAEATVSIKQVMTSEQMGAELAKQQNSLPQAADMIQRPVRRRQVDTDE